MMPLFDHGSESQILATGNEIRIYDLLKAARGYKHAIPIRLLHSVTGLSERAIKEAVHELIVTHKVRIGASRMRNDHGYFMIDTAEDLEVAIQPYKAQILTMLRRLRVLHDKKQMREWLGQMEVEFDEAR